MHLIVHLNPFGNIHYNCGVKKPQVAKKKKLLFHAFVSTHGPQFLKTFITTRDAKQPQIAKNNKLMKKKNR